MKSIANMLLKQAALGTFQAESLLEIGSLRSRATSKIFVEVIGTQFFLEFL